jgi:molybdopterin biosynthesis enzyme
MKAKPMIKRVSVKEHLVIGMVKKAFAKTFQSANGRTELLKKRVHYQVYGQLKIQNRSRARAKGLPISTA